MNSTPSATTAVPSTRVKERQQHTPHKCAHWLGRHTIASGKPCPQLAGPPLCSITRACNQSTIAHTFFANPSSTRVHEDSSTVLKYGTQCEACQSPSGVHPTLIFLPAGETTSFERQTLFNNKYK